MPRDRSVSDFINLAGQSEALGQIVDLTDDELALLVDGITVLTSPVADVCRSLLASWDELDAAGRAAGLLVLANALAEECR